MNGAHSVAALSQAKPTQATAGGDRHAFDWLQAAGDGGVIAAAALALTVPASIIRLWRRRSSLPIGAACITSALVAVSTVGLTVSIQNLTTPFMALVLLLTLAIGVPMAQGAPCVGSARA